ncbi:MAG: hypothetical protein Q4E09_02205 [Eubacteriales bacterium]|nr:hypothetical protein [Eubacteriales bacterium]
MLKEIEYHARLIIKRYVNPTTYILDFACAELAGRFQPGQFLEIDCGGYICRPFALMHQDEERGIIRVGVQIVGESSRRLAGLPLNSLVKLIGPLGNGFELAPYKRVIGIGGSSGIFPLYAALESVAEAGGETALICGFGSVEQAYPRETFEELPGPVYYSSDTGGLDFTGHAGACLEHYFGDLEQDPDLLLLACGPRPLLAYVQKFAADRQIDCQLSLETYMGCGLGLCTGCAVDVLGKDGHLERLRCCVDGPCFDSKLVVF